MAGAILLLVSLLVLGCGTCTPTRSTDWVEVANYEVETVEIAALAYYVDNDGTWPSNSDELTTDGYLIANSMFRGDGSGYTFDSNGRVGGGSGEPDDGDTWPNDVSVIWDDTNHTWTK